MDNSKRKIIAGWVLSIVIALFLSVFSASGKFTQWEGKEEMFTKLGLTNDLAIKIGVLEVIITILFLIPRTAFIGAILITGYLGGAIFTHVRISDNFVFPVVLGVLVWVALGLRNASIFRLAFGR